MLLMFDVLIFAHLMCFQILQINFATGNMVIVGVYPYIATCNNQHGYDAATKLFYLQMIAQSMGFHLKLIASSYIERIGVPLH